MLIEGLESRRLMSVSLSAAGVMTVNGTPDDDVISAEVVGTNLVVSDNGAQASFALSKVKKIEVYAKAGTDVVVLAENVLLPSYIDTGTGGQSDAGDFVRGGGGKDTIQLRSNIGQVYGRGGDDTILVHTGQNGIWGDAGNDTIKSVGNGSRENLFDGGTGVDTIDYSASTDGVVVRNGSTGNYYANTGTPPTVVGSRQDVCQLFENFTGGKGNDYIFGTTGINVLRGNEGNDVMYGRQSADTFYGGSGSDAMFGENGDDKFYTQDGTKDFLSGGLGTDKAKKDASDNTSGIEGVLP